MTCKVFQDATEEELKNLIVNHGNTINKNLIEKKMKKYSRKFQHMMF